MADYHPRHYADNRERLRAEALAAMTPERREAARKRATAWYQANFERARFVAQEKRSRKAGVAISLTRAEWESIKDAYGHRCAYCGKYLERLSQDHVIPISKGGPHTADNVVPCCRPCNSSKRDKEPKRPLAKRMIL